MKKLRYIKAEDLIGKCEKEYNECLIELETRRYFHPFHSLSLSLASNIKEIERTALKAFTDAFKKKKSKKMVL